MPSDSARKLRLVDTSDFDAPSEREISGVHANALTTTAKIPKAQLERLRAMRDEADVHGDDIVLNTDDDPTVMAQAPRLAFEAVEVELPAESPAEMPDSTVVMRYPHVPEAPRVVVAAPLERPITAPPFTPIVGVPQSSRPQIGPGAFEAARVARELARQEQQRRSRMKWLVAGIWAAAFALAGSLAWVVSHEHRAPAPIVSE